MGRWSVKKKETQEVNLLDLAPERGCEWEMDGETVVVLSPKFKNRFLVRTLLPRMKRPNWKIRLDDIGSFVWLQCDGRATVREIGKLMKDRFGEKAEPVYDRLALFLRNLTESRFISYGNLSSHEIDHK